jgi:uncharacterized protein YecE (DUF72 family)
MKGINIGTCSWKYDSWRGIIYPEKGKINYLKEYARHYTTVEIDQWFWSLFADGHPRLPDAATVREYRESVPDSFRFSVKIPNSITLTHHYNRSRRTQPKKNPYFLSIPLMETFLNTIHPIMDKIGVLIFQFEYLSRKKMPGQSEYQDQLSRFMDRCPRNCPYAVEIRNPNYLNGNYFDFLWRNNLSMVFMQGYYLPPIFDIYRENRHLIKDLAVIRLMGKDRNQIEAKTKKKWNRIVEPKDQELDHLSVMLKDLLEKKIEVYVNVNNHYEGSAPGTIRRIKKLLED